MVDGKKEDGGETSSTVVVLRAGLHCEGCADKVRRSIKHLEGVESVKVDFETRKITVVGKLDPAKIKEKVEDKTKKTAQLLSPTKPSKNNVEGGVDKHSEENAPEKKTADNIKKVEEEKRKEDVVNKVVVLKTRVHCDSCARKMNKIIHKYKGVEDVNVDFEKDTVIVKGTMDMEAMLPYMNTKLKRKVEIAIAPPTPSKHDNVVTDKSDDGVGGKGGSIDPPLVKGKEKREEVAKPTSSNGGDKESNKEAPGDEHTRKIEVVNKLDHNPAKLNEHYDQHQQHQNGYVVEYWHRPDYYYGTQAPENEFSSGAQPPQPYYLDAPQLFSDENPNACSVM